MCIYICIHGSPHGKTTRGNISESMICLCEMQHHFIAIGCNLPAGKNRCKQMLKILMFPKETDVSQKPNATAGCCRLQLPIAADVQKNSHL